MPIFDCKKKKAVFFKKTYRSYRTRTTDPYKISGIRNISVNYTTDISRRLRSICLKYLQDEDQAQEAVMQMFETCI